MDVHTASTRLDEVIATAVAPRARTVDRDGAFPHGAVDALLAAGYGGLISSIDVGGTGASPAEAAAVVRGLAAVCGSTAMVYTMHLSAAAAIEALADAEARRAVATGRSLATLAFSESGSRSHFWAPLSTARVVGDAVELDAAKSWVTSAGYADLYVWTSRPVDADGAATLWLVPADTAGVDVAGPFDGFGLRGNASSPVTATGARVPPEARLGDDGAGIDLALAHVLPWFLLLSAAGSVGLCDAALEATVEHLRTTRLEHLDQTLAEQPVARHRLAPLLVRRDAAALLVADAAAAMADGRDDAALRLLGTRAEASEAALAITSEAMRLCGGAGFRKDVGVERPLRDARAGAVMAPTTDALYDMVGRAVCGLPLL